MSISSIKKIDQGVVTPDYEIIENGNDLHLRIAVPSLTKNDVEVMTIGSQLFIRTKSTPVLQEGVKRLGGIYLSSYFEMEFVIDNSITVAAPYLERGVLTVPMRINPEIKMEVRHYTVRELSKADAVSPEGTANWIFSDTTKD